MNQLKEGECYTRLQIRAIVGGGSLENYLPSVDGRIVCACLVRKYNPGAPEIITPGFGPQIQKLAETLCRQKGAIPIFVKVRVNSWQYLGDYEVVEFSMEPRKLAEYERQSKLNGKHKISRIIYLMPSAQNLERRFDREMRDLFTKTGESTGYWPRRFLTKIKNVGGLAAAKAWLNDGTGISEGFKRLAEEDCLDLAMEALVLQKPWFQLFSESELATAYSRLEKYGATAPGLPKLIRNYLRATDSQTGDISDPSRYIEGAARQVTVNAYERSAQARDECLRHYGYQCSVCAFDFGKIYGPHGEGFIHVHHIKPLAELKKEYEVDPIQDLRPVCPNCHAMIHRGGQQIGIEVLKKLLTENLGLGA